MLVRICVLCVSLNIAFAVSWRRAMKASGTRGVIVNVTSAAGLRGGLSPADYSTSKAGVVALTQQAACEAAPLGIRVNSVAPAFVATVSQKERQALLLMSMSIANVSKRHLNATDV